MRNYQSLASFTQNLASKSNTLSVPQLRVQRAVRIGGPKSDTYRVLMSHQPGDFSEVAYANGVQKTFDGRLSMVEGSLDIVDTTGNLPLASMIVVANVQSKPYDQKSVEGMKVITANVLEDADSGIWKVVGEGEDRRLVQASNDDLEGLLQARQARNVVTASVNDEIPFDNGDYLFYYDINQHEIRAGYGYHSDNGIAVFDRKSMKVVAGVVPEQLITVVEASCIDADKQVKFERNHRAQAKLTSGMAEAYLNYMRQLYSGTVFFDKMEKLVAQRRAMGDNGMSMHTSPALD